ncbi:MAG TPA: glycogen synthase GlgA [Candidatus Binataceae bacterium]|nr:glycogen synthase GlgA [Candidatus Binataceae bacterium]
MKIAIVAAEMGPHAKAGGLADVIGALPQAFKRAGAEPCVILPAYRSLIDVVKSTEASPSRAIDFGGERESFRVLRAESAGGIPLYLIDHPGFFDRAEIYGENGVDYPDNARRFVFFGRAAATVAADLAPDVLHTHDWHAAPAAIVARADDALRARFASVVSAFTIHNLAFQGVFETFDYPRLGIDWSWYSVACLEFYGQVNLMKGAVVLADGVATVSRSYANDVLSDPAMSFGLDGVLRDKGERFAGILNGADYDEWDPAKDALIATRYTPSRRAGKKACLYDLREEFKLPHRIDAPVLGMVSRLTQQKGVDLLADALDAILEQDVQLVMLVNGDAGLEGFFRGAAQRHADKLRVVTSFDNTLAHRIQAGSNMFLMPSRYEPCGLTQMYALKYGTAPIVHATGGLKDTVIDFDPATGMGNGFTFTRFEPDALAETVRRATGCFRQARQWKRVMDNCFKADFSWERAAQEYLKWFESLRRTRSN